MKSNHSSVLGDIIERARIEPNHIAAKDLSRELSYAELIDEAARLGATLRGRGVKEGDRVALLIPNSVDFILAALASLWVGAVFVPLAVTDPTSRLETVVADCSPTLIIESSRGNAQYPRSLSTTPLVSMDRLLREENGSAPVVDAVPRVAYMIYTSGTTGVPKGVQIGNEAFVAAVRSTADALGLDPSTRTLCVSPFHFDGSYANVFPTLISGGTVVIRPRDALLFPRTFFKTVAEEMITYSGFTPSYFRLLLASRQIDELSSSSLRTIAFGGESLSVTDLQALWSHAPAIRVFNRYGPTETTIAVTDVELTPSMIEDGTVTIGQPHPGVFFELLDEDGKIIEASNQVGELYIGGIQLMEGYWADPILTQSVLRDIGRGETMYRSGDLVYRSELGNYVYVDRADRVIKRSGVRVSLIELSTLMNNIESISSAACLAYDRDGELGIVAFVTTERNPSDVDLRRAARKLMPDSMIPDRIEHVAEMPLNRSNQLDEAQLLSKAGLKPYRAVSP